METPRRAGRPRAASRDLLEEAACELFLEQGYAATSVADITARAGVSRSTFFNYVDAKSDLLWARFDDGVLALAAELEACREGGDDNGGSAAEHADERKTMAWHQCVRGVRTLAAALPPENVAFAFSQREAMGLGEDLRLAEVRRLGDVRDAVAHRLRAAGEPVLTAEVRATALAGALLAAVREWSVAGAGRHALPGVLAHALAALPGAVDDEAGASSS